MSSSSLEHKKRLFSESALPHLDAVYRFALHLSGNESDAQDLAQECFQQAFRKFHQFRRGTNCKAWLFRITKNAHIDRMRQRSREPKRAAMHDGIVVSPPEENGSLLEWRKLALEGEDALYELFGDEVHHSLKELPVEFRLAVVLCDVEGFTYKEIAEILGCPVGTVRSRISRSRNMLKSKLYDYAKGLGYVKESEEDRWTAGE